MKNILTEALVNSATNASFIFSYTNSAKLKIIHNFLLDLKSTSGSIVIPGGLYVNEGFNYINKSKNK